MADFNNRDSGTNPFLWLAAAGGAGVGFYHYGKNRPTPGVSKSATGPNLTDVPKVLGRRQPRPDRVANEANRLMDLWKTGAFGGFREGEMGPALVEATRASLLAKPRLSLGDIEILTRSLLTQPVTTERYSGILQAVTKSGSLSVFRQKIEQFLYQDVKPGRFFTPQQITELATKAAVVGKGTKLVWKQGIGVKLQDALQPGERTLAQTYLKQLGELGQANLTQVVQRGRFKTASFSLQPQGLKRPININLPLHKTAYARKGGLFIMSDILAGLPSQGTTRMTLPEYQISRMKQDLISRLQYAESQNYTKRELARQRRIIQREFDDSISRYMAWVPDAHHPSAQTVIHRQRHTVGVPALSEFALRKTPGERPNIEAEYRALLQTGKYFPASSGRQIAGGNVLDIDPRNLWLYGQNFPTERRPMQMLREFVPTQAAAAAMAKDKAFGGMLQRNQPYAETVSRRALRKAGIYGPQVAMGYALTGSKAAKALSGVGLEAEELVMNQRLLKFFETERLRTVKIGATEAIGKGSGLSDWVQKTLAAEGEVAPYRLAQGEQLGYSLATGKAIKSRRIKALTEEVINARIVGDNIELLIREKHQSRDFLKLFESRLTTRARNSQYINQIRKASDLKITGLEGFGYASVLSKNRALIQQQMVSGLGMLAYKEVQRVKGIKDQPLRELSKAKIPELQTFIKRLQEDAEAVATELPDELAIIKKAKQWGLDPRLIAGSMEEASKLYPPEYLAAARQAAGVESLAHPSGWVVGMSQQAVGAYRHTVGGGTKIGIRGSVEPRGFAQLLQHQWMVGEQNVAHMLATDILQSMAQQPQGDVGALTTAMESFKGVVPSGLQAVPARGFELTGGPAVIDLGTKITKLGGISQLYYPGYETIQKLGSFRDESGRVMHTNLVNSYKRVVAAAMDAETAASAEAVAGLTGATEDLASELLRQTGISVYGRGGGVSGALRGKMVGSRYLPVSSMDLGLGEALAPGTMEVSRFAGERMYKEMLAQARTQPQKQFIQEQLGKFLGGEAVEGMVERHPLIGQYSIQPTRFVMSKTPGTRSEEFIRAPSQLVNLAVGDKRMQANISPMLGMVADYDDDRLIARFIGDHKTASAVSNLLSEGRFTTDYTKFALEMSAVKGIVKGRMGGGTPAVNEIEQMVFGISRLRLAPAETGGLSSALNEVKLAIAAYRPESAAKFNLMSEAIEQMGTISGKNVGQMLNEGNASVAQRITMGIRSIGEGEPAINELVSATRELLGEGLEKGIALSAPEVGYEGTLQFNYEKMWQEARAAHLEGTKPTGVVSMYRTLARGRTEFPSAQIPRVLDFLKGHGASVSEAAMTDLALAGTELRMGAQASRQAIAAVNQTMQEASKVMGTWGKPALIATAGIGLGLMALSAPKSMSVPATPTSSPVNGGYQASQNATATADQVQDANRERDIVPESLTPPGERREMPQGRRYPSTSYVSPNKQKVTIRAEGDSTPRGGTWSNLTQSIFGNARVSVHSQDSRRRLNSEQVNKILEEP